jgi:hypothetical protein
VTGSVRYTVPVYCEIENGEITRIFTDVESISGPTDVEHGLYYLCTSVESVEGKAAYSPAHGTDIQLVEPADNDMREKLIEIAENTVWPSWS